MLLFEGGTTMQLDDLVRLIAQAQTEHAIEGLTLIGGEPTAQAKSAAALARATQAVGLSVMMFTGHTLEELRSRGCPDIDDLLAHCDLVVDGPYDHTRPDTQRRWIGSTNQRIHVLSARYQVDDPCWREPDTLEIRWQNGTLSVNGFPSRSAVGLWKRPRTLRTTPPQERSEP
jgi:anaerobic ribonucleoside-triphosphate reductase activating protein